MAPPAPLRLLVLAAALPRPQALDRRPGPWGPGSLRAGAARPWFLLDETQGDLVSPSGGASAEHLLLRGMWEALSRTDVRGVLDAATRLVPQFQNTVTHYDGALRPGVGGRVALTIDDALCRDCARAGARNVSLVKDVRELLRAHGGKATFFACSEYLAGVEREAASLVEDGHEFGNHLLNDAGGQDDWRLPAEQLREHVLRARSVTEDVTGLPVRWFRAPRLYYTPEMRRIVEGSGMRNAAADAYCDDWAIEDADWIARTLTRMSRPGSIIVIHMPQRGFREHNLRALDLLLGNLTARGLRAVTLSELARAAGEP